MEYNYYTVEESSVSLCSSSIKFTSFDTEIF